MINEQEVSDLAEVLSDDYCKLFDDGQGQDCSLDCGNCRARRVLEAGYHKKSSKEAQAEVVVTKEALLSLVDKHIVWYTDGMTGEYKNPVINKEGIAALKVDIEMLYLGEPPRTREDELHKPRITTRKSERYALGGAKIGEVYCAVARCPVCDYFLSDKNGMTEELAIESATSSVSNYCPRCGVQLKKEE